MNLGLRARRAPARIVGDALLVPSADPAVWCEELAAQGASELPFAGVRVALLARSRSDRAPVAALLLLPASVELALRARAMPCRRVGDGLWIPADAELFPPLSDAEARALTAQQVVLIHPEFGCTRFAGDELHPLTRFVAAPQAGPAFDRALPAATLPPRLLSVEVAPPADPLASVVAAGADIAQPQPRWQRWLDRLRRPRERSDEALLRMLREDPERGLRHAIPLGGDDHRGKLRGWRAWLAKWFGDRLSTRSMQFDKRRLGGTGPQLTIASDKYHDLERRYRELAEAETRAGRHRRAAFICAHLLNDLPAAADALEAGGCWLEAAHLYEQRLHDPLRAAHCLAAGGELARALAIYRRFDCDEAAGDLLRALGDAVGAEAAYRGAVARYRRSGDPLGAATLLDTKLAAPGAALAELALVRGGPSAPRALRLRLQILARPGRGDALLACLRSLVHDVLPPSTSEAPRRARLPRLEAALDHAEALLDFASTAPGDAAGAREIAKDGVRQLIGAYPELALHREARLSLERLRGLEPDDPLHASDIVRLAQRQISKQPERSNIATGAAQATKRGGVRLPVVLTVDLSAADATGLMLAGHDTRHEPLLLFVPYQGNRTARYWLPRPESAGSWAAFAAPTGPRFQLIHYGTPRPTRYAIDVGRESRVTRHPLPLGIAAVASQPNGRTFVLRQGHGSPDADWQLWTGDATLRLLSTRRIPRANVTASKPKLVGAAGWLGLADDRYLTLLGDDGTATSINLPAPIEHLAIAPTDCALGRLVFVGTRDLHVILVAGAADVEWLAHGGRRLNGTPTFIASDRLVVPMLHGLELLRLEAEGFSATPLQLPKGSAVCATVHPGRFAVVHGSKLSWHEVS